MILCEESKPSMQHSHIPH